MGKRAVDRDRMMEDSLGKVDDGEEEDEDEEDESEFNVRKGLEVGNDLLDLSVSAED